MTAPAGTVLDVAGLIVIAGRTLGIGTDAALAEMDIAAAEAALAEAVLAEAVLAEAHWSATAFPNRAAAASASVALMHALLRHRPFPRNGEQVAVAAALQFLSLNGWQADLNPPAPAAVVIEALASGKLSPDDAAAWLTPRLSPARRPFSARRLAHASGPAAAVRSNSARRPASALRAAMSVLLALAVGGVTLLAAACSTAPNAPVTPGSRPSVVRQSPAPKPTPHSTLRMLLGLNGRVFLRDGGHHAGPTGPQMYDVLAGCRPHGPLGARSAPISPGSGGPVARY